jgi:alanine dehydrogenase
MLIGVPKEIKNHEYRVGMTPAGVRELVEQGHEVVIEHFAGHAIGLTDELYRQAGATIIDSAKTIYERAELIVKVKEPQPQERQWLKPGQILFAYLHLAADKQQTQDLLDSGATCIAYETVTDKQGGLPLLAPMSEIAGKLSIQMGSRALENSHGGKGILLGGVPGITPAKVIILGGGVAGEQAARMAMGLGADTTVLDISLPRLRQLDTHFGPQLKTVFASKDNIEQAISTADLIIGSVLIPGASAPKLISREMLLKMKPATVLVDIAIDQGGCFESSIPTTHENPTFIEQGIIHYCVTNMPGAVAQTATYALTNTTLPFILALVEKGVRQTLIEHEGLKAGLTIHQNKVTHQAVATAQNLNCHLFDELDN